MNNDLEIGRLNDHFTDSEYRVGTTASVPSGYFLNLGDGHDSLFIEESLEEDSIYLAKFGDISNGVRSGEVIKMLE